MRFYSDIEGNETVWDGKKAVPFIDGVIETTDKALIDLLKRCKYRREDDSGETEQRDTGGQAVEKEQVNEPIQDTKEKVTDWSEHTKNDLVKELVKRGIDFNKRQPKDDLIALLEGGE